MLPPREPLPGQCCGNGCTNCVWQVYDRELTRYRQWLDAQPKQQELLFPDESLIVKRA